MIIMGSRGSGKTVALVKLSANKQIPILTFYTVQRQHILDVAKVLGVSIPDPIDLSDLKRLPRDQHPVVIIDEIEAAFEKILETKIDSYSCGREDVWTIMNHTSLTFDKDEIS